MRLLTPHEVAEQTGLPYERALALIKQMNHVQINRRYYVSEPILRAWLNPSEPILVTTQQET